MCVASFLHESFPTPRTGPVAASKGRKNRKSTPKAKREGFRAESEPVESVVKVPLTIGAGISLALSKVRLAGARAEKHAFCTYSLGLGEALTPLTRFVSVA